MSNAHQTAVVTIHAAHALVHLILENLIGEAAHASTHTHWTDVLAGRWS